MGFGVHGYAFLVQSTILVYLGIEGKDIDYDMSFN